MPLEMTYDKIVIGSSLEAILFAHFNKCKILYTRNLCPLSIDKIDDFGLGVSPKKIWEEYTFLLGMSGFLPFSEKIKHLRYESNQQLKIISIEEKVYTINYNVLYVFDDHNFLDLPLTTSSTNLKSRILDTFTYKIPKLDIENIKRDSDFINQIIFEDKQKSIMVVSIVDKLKLDSVPEHLIKIKTEKILDIHNLNLNHVNRSIQDLGKNIYDDFENVKFIYDDAPLIYTFYKRRSKIDYFKYLKLKLESHVRN